jgi:hypothetical protein
MKPNNPEDNHLENKDWRDKIREKYWNLWFIDHNDIKIRISPETIITDIESLLDKQAEKQREEIAERIDKISGLKDQPCNDYKVKEDSDAAYSGGGGFIHQCPLCKSDRLFRGFCGNCNYDHHEGGWRNCSLMVLIEDLTNNNKM